MPRNFRARRLEMFRVLGVTAKQDIGAEGARRFADLGLNAGGIHSGRVAIHTDSFLECGALYHFGISKRSAKQHQRDQKSKSAARLFANPSGENDFP